MTQITRDQQGQLVIGGHKAAELAEAYGTPLYVYSGDGFVAHFTAFTAAVSPLDCTCLLYTSPSPRDLSTSRMPSSA